VFLISAEIAGYKMMKRPEITSYSDMLTGVMNRNAMNNRITGIIEETENLAEPYGVVFADLNGLKRVNDEQGHAAGDLLLKKPRCFSGRYSSGTRYTLRAVI
jgi:diguanylate cyclase (GGDEF)-like protein